MILLPTFRRVASVLCLALACYGVARYPILPWLLGLVLVGYAMLLWRWPALYLFVLPVALIVFDLGIWSGWMAVGESDLFVLVTLAVLIHRIPPPLQDLLPSGRARTVLLGLAASWSVATAIGLFNTLGAPPSDNPFLRPDNALRLAKGLAEALVLFPFLRLRERIQGDAISLLGWGTSLAMVLVAVTVFLERSLFTSLLDFSGTYRVVGPFSSMRIGGGHIGAFIVLALPMALCLPRMRPRWLGMMLMRVAVISGGYALAMTFARTAYAAAVVAIVISGMGWILASRRQNRPFAVGLSPIVVGFCVVVGLAFYGGMRERMVESFNNFIGYRADWQAGIAVRDRGVVADLVGMGLGTYQRAMLMRSGVNRPTDYALRSDDQGAFVVLTGAPEFYFGQKFIPPNSGEVRLSLGVRPSAAEMTLTVMVCDKVLLYSDQCRTKQVQLGPLGVWHDVSVSLPTIGLAGRAWWGLVPRPAELSLSVQLTGRRYAIRDIMLTDGVGNRLDHNGDFARGLDLWGFTDDDHVVWRMFNEYLMLWFETGFLGVAAYLAFAGLAFAGGVRGAWYGAVTGAAVAGSVAGFILSGLFDNLTEAPRLATLFFLICGCGLVQFEDRRLRPRFVKPALPKEPPHDPAHPV